MNILCKIGLHKWGLRKRLCGDGGYVYTHWWYCEGCLRCGYIHRNKDGTHVFSHRENDLTEKYDVPTDYYTDEDLQIALAQAQKDLWNRPKSESLLYNNTPTWVYDLVFDFCPNTRRKYLAQLPYINTPMTEQKNTCEHIFNHEWQFCPMCGKPLKEKEWEPEAVKKYYWVTADLQISSNYPGCAGDLLMPQWLQILHKAGNLFDTREAAEKHLAMVKCVDSQRELPADDSRVLYMDFSGSIKNTTYVKDGSQLYMDILWRLGFAQPDTPEGRALLEKNIREHKEWFE